MQLLNLRHFGCKLVSSNAMTAPPDARCHSRLAFSSSAAHQWRMSVDAPNLFEDSPPPPLLCVFSVWLLWQRQVYWKDRDASKRRGDGARSKKVRASPYQHFFSQKIELKGKKMLLDRRRSPGGESAVRQPWGKFLEVYFCW